MDEIRRGGPESLSSLQKGLLEQIAKEVETASTMTDAELKLTASRIRAAANASRQYLGTVSIHQENVPEPVTVKVWRQHDENPDKNEFWPNFSSSIVLEGTEFSYGQAAATESLVQSMLRNSPMHYVDRYRTLDRENADRLLKLIVGVQ